MGVNFLEPEELAGLPVPPPRDRWWWTGVALDELQRETLESDASRAMVKCARRWGKSTVAAAMAVRRACEKSGCVVVAVSPTRMESVELARLVEAMLRRRGMGARSGGNGLVLGNGSRIVIVPANTKGLTGLGTVSLVVVDGAAEIRHGLFDDLRRLLADGVGDFWMLSTPGNLGGYFWETWEMGGDRWTRLEAGAAERCGRISEEFLAWEREYMEQWFYEREYGAEFSDEMREEPPTVKKIFVWTHRNGVPWSKPVEFDAPADPKKKYRRGYRV